MKKILVFSDLHCNKKHAEKLLEMSQGADLVIGAGDFANQHRGISLCLDILKQMESPFVAVPGNNETLVELEQACLDWENAHVLHGEQLEVAGVTVFGIGGGIPVTPFGAWSYDFTEEQAEQLLVNCEFPDVFVTHSPPFGHVDRTSAGVSVGSSAVLEAVTRYQPQFVVCGHIHDSWEQESNHGNSLILNVGPRGRILNLDSKV